MDVKIISQKMRTENNEFRLQLDGLLLIEDLVILESKMRFYKLKVTLLLV